MALGDLKPMQCNPRDPAELEQWINRINLAIMRLQKVFLESTTSAIKFTNFGIGSGGATTQTGIADASTTHAITDPGDSPASADALRDDLVANAIPSIEAALNALGTKVNALIAVCEAFGFTETV